MTPYMNKVVLLLCVAIHELHWHHVSPSYWRDSQCAIPLSSLMSVSPVHVEAGSMRWFHWAGAWSPCPPSQGIMRLCCSSIPRVMCPCMLGHILGDVICLLEMDYMPYLWWLSATFVPRCLIICMMLGGGWTFGWMQGIKGVFLPSRLCHSFWCLQPSPLLLFFLGFVGDPFLTRYVLFSCTVVTYFLLSPFFIHLCTWIWINLIAHSQMPMYTFRICTYLSTFIHLSLCSCFT